MTSPFRLSILALLFGSAVLAPAAAQQLRGRVVAADTGQPVPFATVGVKGQAVGSTADEEGRFAFTAPPALAATDSVIISCVGFRPVRLTVAQLRRADATWPLPPAVQALREVPVHHAGLKPNRLGTRFSFSPLEWDWSSKDTPEIQDARGWELATMVRVRQNCFIDGFHVKFARNQIDSLRLRFMLYDMQKGKPDRLLLTDDIQLLVPDKRTGWIDLDLRRYNLHLEKGQTIAAGIQWLDSAPIKPRRRMLTGPCMLPAVAVRTLIRQKSEAPWEKYVAKIGMYLDVQQYE